MLLHFLAFRRALVATLAGLGRQWWGYDFDMGSLLRNSTNIPIGDLVWACILMASPVFGIWIQMTDGFNVWSMFDVLLGIIIASAAAFRRTSVLASFVTTFAAFGFYAVLHIVSTVNLGLDPNLFAAPASLWALTRWGTKRWWAIAGLFFALVGSFINPAVWGPPEATGSFNDRWLIFGLPAVFITVLAYVLPAHQRTKAEQHAAHIEARLANQRALLARELHDVVGHGLSAIKVKAQMATYLGTVEGALEEICQAADDSLAQIRDFGEALDQPKASASKVFQALSLLPPAFNVELNDSIERSIEALPGTERFVLLRCVQESVTNMLKHASAGTLKLHVSASGFLLGISAKPNTTDTNLDHDGSGLDNMRTRVSSVGGTIDVEHGESFEQVIEVRL